MQQRRFRKRELLILAAAVAAIGSAIVFRDELMRLAPATSDYDQPFMTVEAMQAMIADADAERTPAVLTGLWSTNRLPQRRFVMSYLREQSAQTAPYWEAVRPIVLEASTGPDADGVTDALGLLYIVKSGEALMYASSMLRDADPRVRWEWVNYVAMMGSKQHAALLEPLLLDASGVVAARAASALAKWTDQPIDVRADDEPQVRKTRSERFRGWWAEHSGDFPKASSLAAAPRPEPSISAYRFTLGAAGAEAVSLEASPGRVVVLHFFSSRCRDCQTMLDALAVLEGEANDRVRIVHVNTDAVAEVYAYDPLHRPLVSPSVADLPVTLPTGVAGLGEPLTVDAAMEAAEQIAAKRRIKSPMVVDVTGETTVAYAALPQPTVVLIDSAGIVRRHFSGPRTAEAIAAMVRAIDPAALTGLTPTPPTPDDPLRTLPTPDLPTPTPTPDDPPSNDDGPPTIPGLEGLPPPSNTKPPATPKPADDNAPPKPAPAEGDGPIRRDGDGETGGSISR